MKPAPDDGLRVAIEEKHLLNKIFFLYLRFHHLTLSAESETEQFSLQIRPSLKKIKLRREIVLSFKCIYAFS